MGCQRINQNNHKILADIFIFHCLSLSRHIHPPGHGTLSNQLEALKFWPGGHGPRTIVQSWAPAWYACVCIGSPFIGCTHTYEEKKDAYNMKHQTKNYHFMSWTYRCEGCLLVSKVTSKVSIQFSSRAWNLLPFCLKCCKSPIVTSFTCNVLCFCTRHVVTCTVCYFLYILACHNTWCVNLSLNLLYKTYKVTSSTAILALLLLALQPMALLKWITPLASCHQLHLQWIDLCPVAIVAHHTMQ